MISHSTVKTHCAVALLILLCVSCNLNSTTGDRITQAFEQKQSDVQVEGEGTVTRLLPDDNSGSRHQKFIVRVQSGQTVLIEHNIDLAPRLDDLKVGDVVSFSGEYIWNQQGGLIHWTHHDPAGKHEAGWIKRAGRIYQ